MSEDYATCWWCRRSTYRTLFLVAFVACYILFGAYIFQLIEKSKEDELRACVQDIRADFLKEHGQCMTDVELEAFIVEIVKASESGVSAIHNVSSEPNWSFGQSIFFAGTILTTIGYGHNTPLSEGGKVFCIIYALIGVPLTLILFAIVVERLMIPSTMILIFLGKKMEHLYKAVYIRFLHLFIVFAILLLFVFIIPSVIFTTIEEEWNFLNSIYYCFISMTTIGLGDYIPGEQPNQKHRTVYKVFITIYLLLGCIIMLFTLAVIYEIPELNIHGLHFYMRSEEQDDEHEQQTLKDSINPGNNYADLDKVAEGGSLIEGSPAREQPHSPARSHVSNCLQKAGGKMSEDCATCWCCRRSTCRTLFLVVLIACYILLGAYIFQLIEKSKEDELRACVQDIRADFLKGHGQCLTDGELEAFIIEIVTASESGVSAIHNVSSKPNWSFGQSILFAGTTLTTIGYGHMRPLSEGGKVFCIVYALIGVPLTLIMFATVVERLMIPSTMLLEFLGKKTEQLHTPAYIRFLHLFIVFTILLLLVFIIPAVIFTTIEEEWNFLDSIYYCFISMTTVGFGDYIPGEQPNQSYRTVYKGFITIYLLLGCIIMLFTLAVMYEIPELNLHGIHFYMRSDELDDEDSINPGNNYTDLDKVAEGGSLNEGSPAREQPE
ncbi:uncharacterized protein LOC135484612 [Lineus longissimus]|uniref:uncharacterized protein LOC135484612 n=1 Tax=Lineus longissimus TaxID=88925 RepID=UPI00315CDD8D